MTSDRQRVWWGAVLTPLMFLVFCSAAALQAAEESPGEQLLTEARQAIASRDLTAAIEKLKAAAALDQAGAGVQDVEAYRTEVERLEDVLHLVSEFWRAVASGAKSLNATEELIIGETRTAVVEFDGEILILRVAGKNVRYDRQALPAKVALTLAERVLKKDDPQNKAFCGAFLLMDGKGSRTLAEQYLREAEKGGVDIKYLLPELERAPTIVIDVPAMTPLMRRALSPNSWTLQVPAEKKVTRQELGEIGKANDDGRLELSLPEDAEPSQVVASRRFAADFRCRMILDCGSAGARFGLFSSSDAGESFSVVLPAGQVKVDLTRQGESFKCQVNGADAKLDSAEGVRAHMAGMLGVELQPGQNCTIQWVEIVGR